MTRKQLLSYVVLAALVCVNGATTQTATAKATVAITSPGAGTNLSPGQTVTATGTGSGLYWVVDLIIDGQPPFHTGAGSSFTFTVPSTADSSQLIRLTLIGDEGSVKQDYNISSGGGSSSLTLVVG